MDDGLKQRVVGAVIIVALGVVFIPKVFNEPALQSDIFGANIPPVPSIADINVNPRYSTSAQEIQQQVESIRKKALLTESRTLSIKPNQIVKSDAKGGVKTGIHNEAKSDATPIKTKAELGPENKESKEGVSNLGGDVWTIQLGSFNKESNATSLRDQIRDKGMRAYIERYRSQGKFVYRVFVGPDLRKMDALSTLERLKQQFGLEGFVVRYQLG